MNNKRLTKVIFLNFLAFFINMLISFFLTPFIVKNISEVAYGFTSLANNFINYAQILTIAINSMAGRFITIEIHKKNYEKANQYFNSVLIANVVIAIILLLPSVVLVLFLDKIISIPQALVIDVKGLFGFTFVYFFISIIGTVFSVATFAANRMDISARRRIESNLIKVAALIALFSLFSPSIIYIGFASLVMGLYILIANIHYTKKLLPNIKVDSKYFDKAKIVEIFKSGIWNTFSKVGYVLSDGLDLLITNLMIGPEMMGALAIAKMIPNVISNLISTLSAVFSPNFTIDYAKNEKELLIKHIKQSVMIMSMISNLALATLVVCGESFFSLWIPTQDIHLIQILSVLTVAGLMINGGLQSIFNIFTVTNKVKMNSIVLLITSFANVAIVFTLLKTTKLGVFAVVGVSTTTAILRNLIFSIPYGAKCLELKWNTFLKTVVINLLALATTVAAGFLAKTVISTDSWNELIVFGFVYIILAFIVNFIIIVNREEKAFLVLLIKNKFPIGKKK